MTTNMTLGTLVITVILIAAICAAGVSLTAATAYAAESKKAASVLFTYDSRTDVYEHRIEGKAVAGGSIKVVYDSGRKSVIFKNNDTIYMRYSYDFWKSCQDVQLTRNSRGQFVGAVELPAGVTTMQAAFFAAYSTDNYRSWGFIWDSNYGKNFSINIISKKELEQKEKFDMLCKLDDGAVRQ